MLKKFIFIFMIFLFMPVFSNTRILLPQEQWLSEHFVKGSILIFDSRTDFVWTKNFQQALTYKQAVRFCKRAKFGNFRNWKLPTIHQLQTIVSQKRMNPATVFPDMPSTIFWSSTTKQLVDGLYVWGIDFKTGKKILLKATDLYSSRCVRK